MNTIGIIGAGQLGSRHLQALKSVSLPLHITVVDPSAASLKTAEERYAMAGGALHHEVEYIESLKEGQHFDLLIVATTSSVRRQIIEQALKSGSVKSMILEKILFQHKEDYGEIGQLLEAKKCQAWVNCTMRFASFYRDVKKRISRGPLFYAVSGSNYGLVTNAMHYIDHMAYLTGCDDYEVTTDGLEIQTIPSKRPGFLELNGHLTLHFKDGSHGSFSCFSEGDTPFLVEIHSPQYRCIVRENEKKAWESSPAGNWQWQEVAADIPYQSQMTTLLVEEILKTGRCPLVSYKESAKLHLTLFEGLLGFLNKHTEKKIDFYPFT